MKKIPSPVSVLRKMCNYCAYRERSGKEVWDKLLEYTLSEDEKHQILAFLKEEKYFDNQRFAKAFARGKSNIKKWGKIKIEQHLSAHQLDAACIKQGLDEIEDRDYKAMLEEIIKKKIEEIQREGLSGAQHKAARYGIQKGYEQDLVWQTINSLLPSNNALEEYHSKNSHQPQ